MTKPVRVCSSDEEPVHAWFGLTYSSYLVVPRSLLQSAPVETQRKLVEALEELEAHFYLGYAPVAGEYDVRVQILDGEFIDDPLADYERGRRVVTREELLALCGIPADVAAD